MDQDMCYHHDREIKDHGARPFIVNIDRLTKMNSNYRTALWTGHDLQVVLMSIPVGGDIGLEAHPHTDQFIRIESGHALVMMGKCKDHLDYKQTVDCNFAAIVPAGTWHNVINIGHSPLKVCTIYAPVEHPFGTVCRTKEDAERSE